MDAWDIIPFYTTAVRLCNQALAALLVMQVSRAALLRNEAAPVGPAVPAEAGHRLDDAPVPHEHDLSK